jgi:hypothetical protein
MQLRRIPRRGLVIVPTWRREELPKLQTSWEGLTRISDMIPRSNDILGQDGSSTLGQAPLGPGVYSASDRNEYQKHKNNNVSGSKVRQVRKARWVQNRAESSTNWKVSGRSLLLSWFADQSSDKKQKKEEECSGGGGGCIGLAVK